MSRHFFVGNDPAADVPPAGAISWVSPGLLIRRKGSHPLGPVATVVPVVQMCRSLRRPRVAAGDGSASRLGDTDYPVALGWPAGEPAVGAPSVACGLRVLLHGSGPIEGVQIADSGASVI